MDEAWHSYEMKIVFDKLNGKSEGFSEILEGKHDDVPEENFYMKGGIEEIK